MDNVRLEKIHFGIVPEGASRELNLQVENIGGIKIDELSFECDHPDVSVKSSPLGLEPSEKKFLVLLYVPKMQLDCGISATLKIRGTYVV